MNLKMVCHVCLGDIDEKKDWEIHTRSVYQREDGTRFVCEKDQQPDPKEWEGGKKYTYIGYTEMLRRCDKCDPVPREDWELK